MSLFERKKAETRENDFETDAENIDVASSAFSLLDERIGQEQILNANRILRKYKEGKANLERKIIDNEQWFKLRHWECMRHDKESLKPVSAWLLNCILNKHAEAMDNYPSANILPREESDKGEAEMLSSIIPVILEQNDFEQIYSDVWFYKLKSGTGVYGVFLDKDKLSGLGDITVRKIDLINLFWESGITDIQKSRNLFHVELQDNDILEDSYPFLEGKLGGISQDLARYIYDDSVDTSGKSAVVDWYYKKKENGRTLLHYCKYVNDQLLYRDEINDNQWQKEFDEAIRQYSEKLEYEKRRDSVEDSQWQKEFSLKVKKEEEKKDDEKNTKEYYYQWDAGEWEKYFAEYRLQHGVNAALVELDRLKELGFIPTKYMVYAASGARGASKKH